MKFLDVMSYWLIIVKTIALCCWKSVVVLVHWGRSAGFSYLYEQLDWVQVQVEVFQQGCEFQSSFWWYQWHHSSLSPLLFVVLDFNPWFCVCVCHSHASKILMELGTIKINSLSSCRVCLGNTNLNAQSLWRDEG